MYNFTDKPNRLNTHSIKWVETETNPNLLPLWIADMDFQVLPEIKEAIKNFADYDVYGYSYAPDSLYQAIINWESSEHGYKITKDDITFIDGVVPGISIAIQAYTQVGDAIIINSPVYHPFARTIKLNERKLVANSLLEHDGRFEIDFESLEQDIVENDVKLYILCSPHNPGGRVWSKEELVKIGQLCKKHGVILLADEIHQDLVLFGNTHHSINTVNPDFSDFTVVLTAATKTFNIAGTKNSFAIIENQELRERFRAIQLRNNQSEISTIGYIATEVAYNNGLEWLRELKVVLEDNINYLIEYFKVNAPKLKVMEPQGTYLLWLDFTEYGLDDSELDRLLKEDAKVELNQGIDFGPEGLGHARLNVAAPLEIIKEAGKRIAGSLAKIN
ncbi:MalY/PatB family protein [Floricoccus penangensis]|uniref:MalY/PatB family protein n=1 Tax=Floricoccus penangensis TaxID=1859475 RepID=UPI00203D4F0E|nr:MalY/PatB family protein [Floricoccus penangensis]URZ87390.1 pyridoxal phosphate-dependent aminotransferase [Floricoccus penangensis]